MTCDITSFTNSTYDCLFDGYLDFASELQLGMMLGGLVAVPLYAKYEDPVPPAIALALLSGVMFPLLPGNLQGVAWAVLFMALTVGIFTAIYRTVIV